MRSREQVICPLGSGGASEYDIELKEELMSYGSAAWERAMTVQEVLLKALSGDAKAVSALFALLVDFETDFRSSSLHVDRYLTCASSR